MVQIGTYISSFDGIAPEDITYIKEAGFDFVALGMSSLKDDNLERHVAFCKDYGLIIDNIHLTGAKTTEMWFEGELGDKVCERYCREIKRAAAAGIPKGVAHITWGHKVPDPVSEIGLSRLKKMADCAKENNFLLCLENSVYIEYLYATMEYLKDHPAVGFAYDCGHHNEFCIDTDLISSFGDRLAVTHIDDNDAVNDLHLMPFDGNVNWERVARDLSKTAFGRQRICAETTFGGLKKIDGLSDDEIRTNIEKLPVGSEKDLYTVEEGGVKFYSTLSYREYLDRLYKRLSKLAKMIENHI